MRSTAFATAGAETLRALGAGEIDGEFYPRYGHPAGRLFEGRMAEREGADGAVAFASGMAALHGVLFGLLGQGDIVAAARDLYGGTSALLHADLTRFGIQVRRFDPYDLEDFSRAADKARLILVETPSNPLCRIVDLAATVSIARDCGALSCVDATFAPPPLQRPFGLGLDLVMHSATKFLGGHHDCLGGVVCSRHELLERLESFRRRSGGVLGPQTAWLLVRSLETLELRLQKATETAGRLATFLQEQREVERVFYPGLASHPDHELASRQMSGFGSMLTIEVQGGLRGACRVYDRFETIARAVSLGGPRSTALLPLHSSHAMIGPELRARAGITDGMIRLSIGLESYAELAAELDRALG